MSGSRRRVAPAALASGIAAATLVGCAPELGACDGTGALRVAYDPDGLAMYEGQAQLVRSCGAGAFCHADSIAPGARQGVPAELDFDVRLAAPDGRVEPAEIARLTRGQFRALLHRHAIWGAVSAGTMPPGGVAGAAALEAAPPFTDAELAPLPGLETPEGRAVLRNWLACGAPVVERPRPRDDGLPSDGQVVAGLDRTPPEPVWSELYARVVAPRCASSACHGSERESELDLRGEAGSLAALRAREGSGECGGGGRLIVPGDPDASLLVQKLEGAPSCGARMPVGAPLAPTTVAAFRAWVAAGAPD
ncbi:MAG: hypothetical protein KF729_17515 [Sandaracinaceae bacterium]|nr:hypothetical protein [Sandaracinaceae bacterium]